jgi:GH24 family phage-related lysozyme (muramidase)
MCRIETRSLEDGTLARCLMPAPVLMCVPPPPKTWNLYSREGGFDASTLIISPEAADLLQAIEGLRLEPYDDQTGKVTTSWVEGATIGYGHLISEKEWERYKDGITEEEAETLFRADVAPFERTVGKTITVGVQQYEFDAMVILAFNIGPKRFENSTVAKSINDGKGATDLKAVENAWKLYNKSQEKVNRGLINRRNAEWLIFTRGLYARW